MPAVSAPLAARVPLVHRYKGALVPRSFVGAGARTRPTRHRGWLAPASGASPSSSRAGSRLQALDADRLVFTDHAGGELVQEDAAAICDAGMDVGYRTTSLRTVLGAELLVGKAALGLRQSARI